jgi:hypothetical protein
MSLQGTELVATDTVQGQDVRVISRELWPVRHRDQRDAVGLRVWGCGVRVIMCV